MIPTPLKSFDRRSAKTRCRTNTVLRLLLATIVVFYLGIQLYLAESSVVSHDDLIFQTRPSPDAYFNNVPVRLRDKKESFHSSVHCAGETHDPATAWKHRSCTYVNLCIDLEGTIGHSSGEATDKQTPEFFLVVSKAEKEFQRRFRENSAKGKFRYSSTEILKSESNTEEESHSPIDVALGGINPLWEAIPTKRVPYEIGIDKIRWAPKIYDEMPTRKYYELDSNVVLVPYHSFAAANAGHLLWDDFLPIYNLLQIFGYETNHNSPKHPTDETKKAYQHLLLRVNTLPQLFGSCDIRAKKRNACKKNLERFLPLFGIDPNTFSTLTEARLTKDITKGDLVEQQKRANLPLYPICAKHAVAGLGWLTDHGIRNHGWMANREKNSLDVALAHNVGRGPELYSFRNFVLNNIGFETNPWHRGEVSFRILLSAHSSNHPDRSFGFQQQKGALQKAFPMAEVEVVELADMLPEDQIHLVSGQLSNENPNAPQLYQHTIFVSACGGGSVTSFFLPRGSSLILYYNEIGGTDYFKDNQKTGGKALLDWDLMNNLGYLNVHWLPTGSMNDQEGIDSLISLVQHEIEGVLNGLVYR